MTQLIFGWADMKIEAMRENRKRGRKKAHWRLSIASSLTHVTPP